MIYYLQQGDSGPIKIGYSAYPFKRMRQLQTANSVSLKLLLIVEGTKGLERRLHRQFSHLRIQSEWFSPSSELMSYISNIKTYVHLEQLLQ